MRMEALVEIHERFTRCWTLAQPIVASYLCAAVPDFHEAEDLLQNVSIVCLRKFSTYDERRPFVAWALGMAKIELLRLRRTQMRLPLLHDEKILEELASVSEELEPRLKASESALAECLHQLQGRAAALIRLRYDEALKPAAIAQRLGMAAVAVRVALSRVRAALRQCIDEKVKSSRPNA
jgi:RNA polymerase sigma-70 factor (ECF subfamily)